MTRRRTPSVLTALNAALRAQPADSADAATVALAKRYALELDDAAVISQALARTLRKLAKVKEADELYDEVFKLAARIEEVHVAATIGPKLLSALEQLNLTPKARSAVVAPPAGGGGASAGPSALDQLRARRANRTTVVDPASS